LINSRLLSLRNLYKYLSKSIYIKNKKLSEQTESKNIFKELKKIELEASSLTIKEITKNDQVLSYYLEQNKDGTKKGITLKKSDFGKLRPIFQEIDEK